MQEKAEIADRHLYLESDQRNRNMELPLTCELRGMTATTSACYHYFSSLMSVMYGLQQLMEMVFLRVPLSVQMKTK